MNFKAISYESTSFSRTVVDKLHPIKLGSHGVLCLTDSFVLTQDHCVNFEAIRYESTSFNRIVADKLQCVKLESHDALCLTDSFVLTLDHCVNLEAIRYESTSFHRIVALRKAWVTRCALSDRFFCIHDRSLCEFQSDKI